MNIADFHQRGLVVSSSREYDNELSHRRQFERLPQQEREFSGASFQRNVYSVGKLVELKKEHHRERSNTLRKCSACNVRNRFQFPLFKDSCSPLPLSFERNARSIDPPQQRMTAGSLTRQHSILHQKISPVLPHYDTIRIQSNDATSVLFFANAQTGQSMDKRRNSYSHNPSECKSLAVGDQDRFVDAQDRNRICQAFPPYNGTISQNSQARRSSCALLTPKGTPRTQSQN